MPTATCEHRRKILRFLLAVAVGNLLGKVAYVRLYSLRVTGSANKIASSVLDSVAGDVLTTATTVAVTWVLPGRTG